MIDYQRIDEIKLGENCVLECPSTFCEQFSNLEPIFNKNESETEIHSLTASYDDIENFAISSSNSNSSLDGQKFCEKEFPLKNDLLDLHTEQIFLGMVSMQYKARIVIFMNYLDNSFLILN